MGDATQGTPAQKLRIKLQNLQTRDLFKKIHTAAIFRCGGVRGGWRGEGSGNEKGLRGGAGLFVVPGRGDLSLFVGGRLHG